MEEGLSALDYLYHIQWKKLRGIETSYKETKIHESIFNIGIAETLLLIKRKNK
jgi:hypothetical protein